MGCSLLPPFPGFQFGSLCTSLILVLKSLMAQLSRRTARMAGPAKRPHICYKTPSQAPICLSLSTVQDAQMTLVALAKVLYTALPETVLKNGPYDPYDLLGDHFCAPDCLSSIVKAVGTGCLSCALPPWNTAHWSRAAHCCVLPRAAANQGARHNSGILFPRHEVLPQILAAHSAPWIALASA